MYTVGRGRGFLVEEIVAYEVESGKTWEEKVAEGGAWPKANLGWGW